MNLPSHIERCHGFTYLPDTMDSGFILPQCLDCARRLEGVRDYIAGADVAWMEPPREQPCSEKLARKS